jgi:hypothetical protein
MSSDPKIAVIGLGYVGLPLAVALARHFAVTGFDIDTGRIAELRAGHDRTDEVAPDALRDSALALTDAIDALPGHDIFIVTVPTPVDATNQPDLGAVLGASKTVGAALAKGAIVVYESTVYPGVTEDICGPALEAASGLVCGTDFFLGYSPERINPGDCEHTVDRITKVVAGQTPDVTDTLADVYGRVTSGGIFRARDIKTAEAAKVIENAQRDINIAFVNVDDHRGAHRVEPICKVLPIAPSTYHEHVAKRDEIERPLPRTSRSMTRARACPELIRGMAAAQPRGGYGGALHRRATAGRPRPSGRHPRQAGSNHGAGQAAPCPLDHVNRVFPAPAPNLLWLSNFSYVKTWSGFV